MKLKNVRIAFCENLFVAGQFKPGEGAFKFKSTFLIEKDSPLDKAIEAEILKVATAKWGPKAPGILKTIRTNPNKFCYQDGNNKTYDGYQGHMALSSSNGVKPLVIDEDKNEVTQQSGKVYAGCYVNATVDIFAYTNSGNGVSASLTGVQFCKPGDAFAGGRAASPDEFDVVEGADAGDLA